MKSRRSSQQGGRLRTAGVVVAALALLVAACAGDDEPAASEPEPAAPSDEGSSDDDAGDGVPADEDPLAAAREFYEGASVEIAVQYDAGGGFDVYARQFAPFLADALGATVTVLNEPGAGGLISLNNTQRGEPDGLRIQFANGPFSVAPDLAGSEGVNFDLSTWNWLGALVIDPQLVVASADHEIDDFQDVVSDAERNWVFAGTSGLPGAVIGEVFGLTYNNVTGFGGSPDAVAALLRGEADFHAVSAETLIPQVEAGDLKALALFGTERLTELPDVPLLTEFEAISPEMDNAMRAHIGVIESGRSFAVRDGVPEDRVELLREVFWDIVTSDEFEAHMEEIGRSIGPRDGEAVQQTIDDLYAAAPPPYIAILEESYE